MRYKQLDLNLLVALDALLQEQNTTKAALRLNISQSTISGMLGRLRTHYGDQLLVPVGRRMQCTPLAKELAAPVHELLRQIDNTITFQHKFVPSDEQRNFRIAASDYAISLLLAPLIRRMRTLAPRITFELIPLFASPGDILKDGQTDLVIIQEEFASEEQPQEHLLSDSYCCVIWTGNSNVGKSIDIQSFAAGDHVTPLFGLFRTGALDESIFHRYGIERRLQVTTHDFASMAQMVVETDLIATMPTRLATTCAERYAVRLMTPPMALPAIRLCMQWHRHLTEDPCHGWLRDELSALARMMPKPGMTWPSPSPASTTANARILD